MGEIPWIALRTQSLAACDPDLFHQVGSEPGRCEELRLADGHHPVLCFTAPAALDFWAQKRYFIFVSNDYEQAVERGPYFGASSASNSNQRLALYLPTKDRNGRQIPNHDVWFKRAIHLLTMIGGGATVLPARGAWYNPASDEIIEEPVDFVYTFYKAQGLEDNCSNLRTFLHRLGIETDQGEVAFEFDGQFYRIDEFDPSELEG